MSISAEEIRKKASESLICYFLYTGEDEPSDEIKTAAEKYLISNGAKVILTWLDTDLQKPAALLREIPTFGLENCIFVLFDCENQRLCTLSSYLNLKLIDALGKSDGSRSSGDIAADIVEEYIKTYGDGARIMSEKLPKPKKSAMTKKIIFGDFIGIDCSLGLFIPNNSDNSESLTVNLGNGCKKVVPVGTKICSDYPGRMKIKGKPYCNGNVMLYDIPDISDNDEFDLPKFFKKHNMEYFYDPDDSVNSPEHSVEYLSKTAYGGCIIERSDEGNFLRSWIQLSKPISIDGMNADYFELEPFFEREFPEAYVKLFRMLGGLSGKKISARQLAAVFADAGYDPFNSNNKIFFTVSVENRIFRNSVPIRFFLDKKFW